MFKDREGHTVEIKKGGNGHVLVYGNSGQGKTFFICRMLEEYCRQGKRILIIDFSGSYTKREMKQKGFLYPDEIQRFIVKDNSLRWVFRTKNEEINVKDVTDAMLEVLRCESYFQKKLLTEANACIMEEEGIIRFPSIVSMLEKMLERTREDGKATGDVDNLNRLLTRLYPYNEITNFEMSPWPIRVGESKGKQKLVTIIDLTAFPEGQRKFLTELIISLLWREIYRQERKNRCDVLLLDEMQFLPVNDGSTLSSMLREGRKKGLELVLSTQFLSGYSEAEKSALMQADTKIIFHPTPEDIRYSAKIIDPTQLKIWENEMQKLRMGECVLKGNYALEGRKRVLSTPLVIRAVNDIKDT